MLNYSTRGTIALQSFIYILLIFALCGDVTWYPWQPLVIQHDFFNCIIGGYLYTKFQIPSITYFGDIARGPTRPSPSREIFKKAQPR